MQLSNALNKAQLGIQANKLTANAKKTRYIVIASQDKLNNGGMRGDGLVALLSFKMTQWSCCCIGESVCYWLEKAQTRDDEGLH